jgi:hypothetical protein
LWIKPSLPTVATHLANWQTQWPSWSARIHCVWRAGGRINKLGNMEKGFPNSGQAVRRRKTATCPAVGRPRAQGQAGGSGWRSIVSTKTCCNCSRPAAIARGQPGGSEEDHGRINAIVKMHDAVAKRHHVRNSDPLPRHQTTLHHVSR